MQTEVVAMTGSSKRGNSTAAPLNVRYRIGSIAAFINSGRWLDYGCADGGYAEALLAAGAAYVVGIDIEVPRIVEAQHRHIPHTLFQSFNGRKLPFSPGSFDGAFMNETMEHVFSEKETLTDLHRVIKSGGYLVVISPNRWFPIEGHTTRIGKREISPMPLIPWLPKRLTKDWVDARNYWPHELRNLVSDNGFEIVKVGYIWPVFELLPWLPAFVIRWYQRHLDTYAHIPIIRRFGVSTLVIGRRK
jgi:SAM-dependent methyltransferase